MNLQIKFSLILSLLIGLILLAVDILSRAFNLPVSLDIALCIFLIAIVLYIAFYRMVSSPLKDIKDALYACMSGEKSDLSARINIKTNDEFEEVALLFNKFVSTLYEKNEQTKAIAEKLISSSNEISSYLQEMNDSVAGLTGTIEQISGAITNQTQCVEEINQVIGHLTASARQVADTIAGLATSSDEVSKTSRISKVFAQEMLDKINETSTVITESAIRVQVLSERSQQISEIVKVINAIADQVNLLALNAAIEAARAGEAGRGFAVVAEEVRKLADESASSTVKIKNLIKEIQAETAQAMSITDKGSKEIFEGEAIVDKVRSALDDIGTQIQQVSTTIASITHLTQQQAEATTNLISAIQKITTASQDTAIDTRQALSVNEQRTASLKELSIIAQELCQVSRDFKKLISPEESDTKQPLSESPSIS